MDSKLLLLKNYLLAKVATFEQERGSIPFRDQDILTLTVLANSDPGVISLFIAKNEPESYSSSITEFDVWFDLNTFYERTNNQWREFDEFKDEFKSTLIDLERDSVPLDVPTRLKVVGPLTLNKSSQTVWQYSTLIVFSSGLEYPFNGANWSLETTDGAITINDRTGLLEFSSLASTTTVSINVDLKLADQTYIYGSLDVEIVVTNTVPNIRYDLVLSGPQTVQANSLANYTARLDTFYADGTTASVNVTSIATWTIGSQAGTISRYGNFRAANVFVSQTETLAASYTIDGNLIRGTLTIEVYPIEISSFTISGPLTVQELRSAHYTARLELTNGETSTPAVTWEIADQSLGAINSFGYYTAPNVIAESMQVIRAVLVYQEKTYTAELPVQILDVVPPSLVIDGPSEVLGGQSTKFKAFVTFQNETVEVSPTWTLSGNLTNVGTLMSDGTFYAANLITNESFRLSAALFYLDYPVHAEAQVQVLANIINPLSLDISGPDEILESTVANYAAKVLLTNQQIIDVTNDANTQWRSNNAAHAISLGELTATGVNTDTLVTLTSQFTNNGITVSNSKVVKVKDNPEVWTPVKLTIIGPASVNENTITKYTANVDWIGSKGSAYTETNATVSWYTSLGTVTSNGNLSVGNWNAALATVTLSAVFVSSNATLNQSLTVSILNVPYLLSLALQLSSTSTYGGFSVDISAVLQTTANTLDVSISPKLVYTCNDSSVSFVQNRVVTTPTTSNKTVTITARYTENDETVQALVTLEVKANLANTLVISPSNVLLYDQESADFTATLTLLDSTSKTVIPTWLINGVPTPLLNQDSSIAASFTNNKLIAGLLDKVEQVTVTGQYTGVETGGSILTSNMASVDLLPIIPVELQILNDSGLYSVNENSSLQVRAKLKFNNGSEAWTQSQVSYALSAQDQAKANLSLNSSTGYLTITPNPTTQDLDITVLATYLNPKVFGGKLEASKPIHIYNINQVIGIQLLVSAGPYYENGTYTLSVKEKLEDGTLGAEVSPITWTYDANIVSIDNKVLTIKELSSNQSINLLAGYQSFQSAVTLSATDVVPLSITVSSSLGSTVRRGQSTNLLASITLNDGSSVNPSLKYPITWGTNNTTLGSLTTSGYTASYSTSSAVDGSVEVTASCLGIQGKRTLIIDGFPLPESAVITGPSTIVSGTPANYSLTIKFSDGAPDLVIDNDHPVAGASFLTTFNSASITNSGVLTVPIVAVAVTKQISATYVDPISNQQVSANYSITATPPQVLAPSSAVLTGKNSLSSGEVSAYTLTVTMNDGSIRVINSTNQTYTATWSKTHTAGSITQTGVLTAPSSPVDTSGVVTATYTFNGVTVSSTLTVNVAPMIASSLALSPATLSLFEGQTQVVTATLNTGVTVNPTRWTYDNTKVSITNSTITLLNVNATTNTQILAYFTGAQTNNVELVSNALNVEIKNIVPVSIEIYNAGSTYQVNEGQSLTLKSRITLSNGVVLTDPIETSYQLDSTSYATLSDLNGVATIVGKTVTANQAVVVQASYMRDGVTVTNTKSVTINNSTALITSLVLDSVDVVPYMEGSTLSLRLRELNDESNYGAPITSGIVWNVSPSNLASVSGATATLGQVSGNQNVTFTATYNGRTSNTLSVTIVDKPTTTTTTVAPTTTTTTKAPTTTTTTTASPSGWINSVYVGTVYATVGLALADDATTRTALTSYLSNPKTGPLEYLTPLNTNGLPTFNVAGSDTDPSYWITAYRALSGVVPDYYNRVFVMYPVSFGSSTVQLKATDGGDWVIGVTNLTDKGTITLPVSGVQTVFKMFMYMPPATVPRGTSMKYTIRAI